jgi:hypothetical protein
MSVRVRIFFVHLHEYNNEKNYEERKEKIKNEFGDSNYHVFFYGNVIRKCTTTFEKQHNMFYEHLEDKARKCIFQPKKSFRKKL